jgi:hypothetical protein
MAISPVGEHPVRPFELRNRRRRPGGTRRNLSRLDELKEIVPAHDADVEVAVGARMTAVDAARNERLRATRWAMRPWPPQEDPPADRLAICAGPSRCRRAWT